MNESYETILVRMQDKFKELSGFDADDASDIGIRLKVLAGEIFSAYTNIEWLKNQVFPQTAIGQQLDYHAQQRGIKRKSALKASGTLKFSLNTALSYDVNIPEGTVCSTAQSDGVRYLTTNDAVLKAGETYVYISAEAEKAGIAGNCLENTITLMITPPTGISMVINESAFVGGSEEENDDSLRARILESYKNISNGTNSAFYRDQVLKNEDISSVGVIPKNRGDGTVDIYIWSNSGAPTEDLISEIQAKLNDIKEINVDILVSAPTTVNCNVYLTMWVEEGYVYNDVKNECVAVIKDYINSLGIGEDMLLAKACNAVFNIPGVKNYKILTSSCSDMTIDDNEIGVPGTIGVAKGS